MSPLKVGLFYLIFFFLGSNCFAQTLKSDSFITSDGLGSDEVYNLHQDKKGYIWVFTNYGTLTYNDTEFKKVLLNLPFNESLVYSIYEQENGRKWIANSQGKIYEVINDSAFQVRGTEETFELLRKAVSEIVQLHVDDSLNIYALTKHHSYKFILGKNGYAAFSLSTGKNDSIAFRLHEKNNRLLYLRLLFFRF